MTPIHLIGSTYAVEVPEDAHGLDINKYGNGSELNYWLIAGAKDTLIVIDLPAGNWQIICTTKECLKKVPMGIVECKIVEYDGGIKGTRFVNYLNDNQRTWFINKTDSFRSFLLSRGLNPQTNYVIIKKVS
jgi:hypothetical protein